MSESIWKDRVALVTGASSGIGEATARKLLDLGMNVAVCARRPLPLDAIAADYPGRTLPGTVDLRDPNQIAMMFRRIRQKWGGVDVLVNNAGLGHDAPLMTGDTEHWREMLQVNVLALCICTREAVSDMRRRGDEGHVIHIGSMAGHRVPGGSGVYSATKFAVRSLTEGLRLELRQAQSRIRVTAISPGFVETGFAENYHKDPRKAAATYGRFQCLQSADIADAVAFVLDSPPHMAVHDMLIRPTEQKL